MNEYAIEARVTNEGPKTGIAFAFWWLLGLVGGHRYYLGRNKLRVESVYHRQEVAQGVEEGRCF